MKKLILYIVALLTALAAASCTKDVGAESGSGEMGVLKLNISATRAETDGAYDPLDHIVVQLYNADGGLLRKYTSPEDLPQRFELLAGSYRITVDAGELADASAEKRFYTGEKTFDVVAGQTSAVEVVCKIVNTVVDVKFDESVTKNFGTNFYAWVVAANKVDEQQAADGAVPALRFTTDGKGYFILPEGVTTLAWKFVGTHNDRGEVVKEDLLKDVKGSSKYQLTFRYSKDLPGYIDAFLIRVDTSTDDQDDTIIFSPDPTIEGDGFDMTQPQDFIPGKWTPRTYKIATMSATKSVSLSFAGTTYNLLGVDNTPNGITVSVESPTRLSVTLDETLFAKTMGGAYAATFAIRDVSNGALESQSAYRLQGMLPLKAADYDLWKNSVVLRAMVLDPESTGMTFGLRTKNGEWKQIDGVKGSDGLFTATFAPEWVSSRNDADLTIHTPVAGTGVFAANDYEYSALIDGTQTTASFSTPAGDAIYNAGMDLWSTYNVKGSTITGGTVPFPNENSSTAFWVGSNNGNTSGMCTGVTEAGNNGSKCAQLKPQIATGNNFGSGSMFTGTFECGTGLLDMFGYARFGIKYTFTARPKALRIHYKASINKYTHTGKTGMSTNDLDYGRIFVCVTDWNDRHSVKSGVSYDASTFWDPATANRQNEGPILGYGSKLITQSTDGWVTEELPMVWYDTDAAPAAGKYSLVISSATSYKGDYMGGSESNRLFIEDFEWVY